MVKYRCTVCDYIFDEETEGKKWEELSDNWVCPDCGVGKDQFEKVGE